jgi:hypothetical protein
MLRVFIFTLHNLFMNFKKTAIMSQDFSECITDRSMEKFTNSFMRSGNVNLINDVLKAYHQSGNKISMVSLEFYFFLSEDLYLFPFNFRMYCPFFLFDKFQCFFHDSKISLELWTCYWLLSINCLKINLGFHLSMNCECTELFIFPDSLFLFAGDI